MLIMSSVKVVTFVFFAILDLLEVVEELSPINAMSMTIAGGGVRPMSRANGFFVFTLFWKRETCGARRLAPKRRC